MLAIFPEIAAAAHDLQIETVSYLVRKYFGQEKAFHPVLNTTHLSQSVGIPISFVTMQDFGALAVKDENGRFSGKLLVNQDLPELEKSFLIAHSLGTFFFISNLILPEVNG